MWANQEHEGRYLTMKKYRSSNQQRKLQNMTSDEVTHWREYHPTADEQKTANFEKWPRESLLPFSQSKNLV